MAEEAGAPGPRLQQRRAPARSPASTPRRRRSRYRGARWRLPTRARLRSVDLEHDRDTSSAESQQTRRTLSFQPGRDLRKGRLGRTQQHRVLAQWLQRRCGDTSLSASANRASLPAAAPDPDLVCISALRASRQAHRLPPQQLPVRGERDDRRGDDEAAPLSGSPSSAGVVALSRQVPQRRADVCDQRPRCMPSETSEPHAAGCTFWPAPGPPHVMQHTARHRRWAPVLPRQPVGSRRRQVAETPRARRARGDAGQPWSAMTGRLSSYICCLSLYVGVGSHRAWRLRVNVAVPWRMIFACRISVAAPRADVLPIWRGGGGRRHTDCMVMQSRRDHRVAA